MEALNTIKILDIPITSDSEKNILEFIITRLKKKGVKTKIFTPNPEIVTYATKHPSLKKILSTAEVNLPDGVGLVWAARMTKQRLQGRITGVDFMQKLCEKCVKEGVSIGLLGGKDGVALKTAECLAKKYPGLKIEFVGEEWDSENRRIGESESQRIGESEMFSFRGSDTLKVRHSDSSDSLGILFVAFGFPKQEEWIAENLQKLPIQAMMGVGGSFDFLSGKVSRAPKWVQNLGLEWLFRLIRQPWRWKRQLALIEFIKLVISTRS